MTAAEADRDRLVRMFRQFGELEFRGRSPAYERLALALADTPELARPLLAAAPRQRRALLYFAAAQYLLRTAAAGHPFGAYLPAFGGTRAPDDGLVAAFADLVTGFEARLTELCATRTTQTNEASRCGVLRPGFSQAALLAHGRPLALVDLGTSAGLLLLPDRYGYRYTGGGRDESYGRADAPAALVMTCEIRGGGWPDVVTAEPRIGPRTGIDLNPVDATDDDAVRWLRSCVWPEQLDRWCSTRRRPAVCGCSAPRPRQARGRRRSVPRRW